MRRDVLEGTWEEMLELEDGNQAANTTVKRQAEFPDLDTNSDQSK